MAHRLLGGCIAFTGAVVALGGVWLMLLGGSWYYGLTGVVLAFSGVLILMRRRGGSEAYLFYFLSTVAWAVWEVGLHAWLLMPRVLAPAILGLAVLCAWLRLRATLSPLRQLSAGGGAHLVGRRWPKRKRASAACAAAVIVSASSLAVFVYGLSPSQLGQAHVGRSLGEDALGEWRHYGSTLKGQRYSALREITPENVPQLRLAWTYRTGDPSARHGWAGFAFEATPLKVGDALYLCTPNNVVVALDPETGQELWRYDPVVRVPSRVLTCRGVSYHEADLQAAPCSRRILLATNDARLIALDAESGQLCPGFGQNGTVDLKHGLGEVIQGQYRITSPPTVVDNLAVVGAYVLDNMWPDAPSGVIRAFDVITGALAWNWDPARPDSTEPLAAGQTFARSSPNSWGPASADEALGLIYLPMAVQGPDAWGGARDPVGERFSSAVVSLEIRTGRLRWVYQAVHHDLWNLDIGSQPTLIDLVTPDAIRPALLIIAKSGDIFVLDRRDGQLIVPAPERPVPQGAAPGDWVSPTQPFSELSFRPQTLTETDMWGITPLDHLWCRIQFRRYRYEGMFTPPSVEPPGTLTHPGHYGVFNWGGAAVDERRNIMVVNPGYIAYTLRLRPAMEAADKPATTTGGSPDQQPEADALQRRPISVPFVAERGPFFSPLGVPCHAPPWGYLAAVDMQTNRVLWQRPIGTSRDVAPLGLSLPLGVPSLGGPILTAGGLILLAGTLDSYLRAFDLRTGEELWRGRLPAGGQATPMTYAAKSGRQFVVIAAGGHSGLGTTPGDYVVAYALPD